MVYKTTLKSLFSFIIICLFFVGFGFGQSIFSNPIEGINPHTDNPFTSGQTYDENISVSGIGRGTDISTPVGTTNNRYNARSWSTGGTLDTNDYFEFTITPNSGYEIDFVSFVYIGQRSETGPPNIEIRSSLDGYSSNIGVQTLTTPSVPSSNTVYLSNSAFLNVATSITFRVFAWGSTHGNGTFSINEFTFNGVVSALPCVGTVTWNGSWSGMPDVTTEVILETNYDTLTNGGFSACSLTVSNNSILNIADNDYVEVQNDLTINVGSTINVQPYGAFIQNNNSGNITNNGTISVSKDTAPLNNWYEYTYWSSPISNATVGSALSDSDPSRRFIFNASLFNDEYAEVGNDNNLVFGMQDDVDDEGDDWQRVNGDTFMLPGVGYAATHSEIAYAFPGANYRYTFQGGDFNNGVIPVPVYRNDTTTNDNNWNLIGNPYPSAIDIDAFMAKNMYDVSNPAGTLEGAIYFWSQNTNYSSTANGNQALNFDTTDYAQHNGIGGTVGGDGLVPNGFIPSGQAFFVSFSNDYSSNSGTVEFNNSMRNISLSPDNSQFFKNSNSKTNSDNKLWINLTSDNGVFNQILIGYANGATDNYDGSYYDAHKIVPPKSYAALFSLIENSNKKFAIQGKATNSLNTNETIKLGFTTNINVATLYTLSMAKLQGEFLTNNTIYLKDNLLNKVHNLSGADYTFTSEVGEFNDRFVVMFNNQSLSTDQFVANANTLNIIDLDSDRVKFTTTNNLKIKTVFVFDLLGRELYQFKGENSEETYLLSALKNTIYIAKVELSNGAIITKKAIKK